MPVGNVDLANVQSPAVLRGMLRTATAMALLTNANYTHQLHPTQRRELTGADAEAKASDMVAD
eukprot:2279124-Pyramimonas_sp.AAC.1